MQTPGLPVMPQVIPFPMPQPFVVPVPSAPPQAPADPSNKEALEDRRRESRAVQRAVQRGGRASTIVAGRKIAGEKQAVEGMKSQGKRKARSALGYSDE